MKDFFLKLDLAFHFIVILIIGVLVFGFFRLDEKFKNIPELISSQLSNSSKSEKAVVDEGCGKECEEEIEERVSKAIAKIPSTSATSKTTTSNTRSTTYIPLNGTLSTLNMDWVDVPSSDVYIKAEDYGKSPYISFEASAKTSHQNGRVYVRLFDVTNSIAVDGSELSSSSQSFETISSGNLPFWNGNNLYRVQIKSIDGQEVSFSSGRIKIVAQ